MEDLPAGYALRSARMEDIPAFAAIETAADALFEPTGLLDRVEPGAQVPEEAYRSAIENRLLFLVEAIGRRPVGFALCSARAPDLYLDQIAVDPAHGRKGIGQALIMRVIREAEARQFDSVSLSTFRDVPWNAPYYERFGFRALPRKKLEPWMLELEEIQAETLDVDKRCFMRRRVRSRWTGLLARR